MTKTTRHDTDGQAYLAYYRKDHVLGFVWDGNIEHPIQVQHEMGEPTAALFGVFKEACDHYADTRPTYDTSLDPISPDFDARSWDRDVTDVVLHQFEEAPAKPKVSLKITCQLRAEGATRPGEDYPRCAKDAVILLVSEQEVWHAGDVQETLTVAEGVCADHAPETVHEVRCSMAEDEFLVVTLPVDYPEVPTPETWPAGTRLHAGDSWGTVDEWQGRTVWRIKWDNGTSFTGATCSGYGKGN